jgi:hypothetical protein
MNPVILGGEYATGDRQSQPPHVGSRWLYN